MSAEKAIDITRYTIISKIGEGSFSKVYRVKDNETKISYAAKISKFMIDDETKDSPESLSLFREVNLMSLLNHPSVLQFVGYYQTNFEFDPLPTIVTELALNGSLRDIINMESQGLAPDEWNFTKKLINIYGIASGMSYLHSHNVLHRDLKPENILVDEYLNPKISDFGLSKITEFLSASMNIQSQKGMKGTPAYMAPEIMSDEKYSKSGDVYAFGFIVFEIMTCEEPFKNFNIMNLMKKVMNDGYRPVISDDVPNSYRELIERCWSQEAESRPSFDEIVSELKTNEEFITDLVDGSEFYDYVDFISNYRNTFDVSKQRIHFTDFIKKEGRNKNVKPILFNSTFSNDQQKTTSNEEEFNDQINITNERETKEEKLTSSEIKYYHDNSTQIFEDDETSLEENHQRINESEMIPTKINEDEESNEHDFMFPLEEFKKLSKNNQHLVEEAEKDSEKQFEVGRYLIEGQNTFPKIVKLGLQYIKHSVNQNCINATVYYIEHLIKGKIIKKDLDKASEFLIKLNNIEDNRKYLLQGLISYKKNKFTEAAGIYEEGSKHGNSICMYKYGKMLFIGEGIQKNIKESMKYFTKSKEEGYAKSEYFLTSLKVLNSIKNFTEFPPDTQIIFIMNNIRNKENQRESEFDEIVIQPKKTEKIFFNKSMKSPYFSEIMKRYRDISIEIGYPSESSQTFKSIIDLVIKIRNKTLKQMNIGIVFTSFSNKITKECFSKYISYHRIDSSIQIIPSDAFTKCSLLKQITIPSSVTNIGNSAFSDCSSLVQITIPSSVTQIRNSTFSSCSSLKKITIPSSVTNIGKSVFSHCSSLTRITIPSSITQIGGGIFNGCIKLHEIAFQPGGKIEFEYFENKFLLCKSDSKSDVFDCFLSTTTNSEEIILPSFIKIIKSDAFSLCSSLKQITIPSSVTQIRNYAFFYCSSLKQITIPSSVTDIEDSTFSHCSSLAQITIPSSVTRIGYFAFSDCSSLTQITIPSSVTQIGNSAFSHCSSLKQITIPSSVTQIGNSVFSYCSSLKQITIPSSVTQFKGFLFERCSSLKQITIPSSVTQIENYVFSHCSSLTQVTIPSSVTRIGYSAFSDCSSLKQITIPSSVTHIGNSAFSDCSSLKQIAIPSYLNIDGIGFNSKVKINRY